MSRAPVLLGIDLGTTRIKVGLVAPDGGPPRRLGAPRTDRRRPAIRPGRAGPRGVVGGPRRGVREPRGHGEAIGRATIRRHLPSPDTARRWPRSTPRAGRRARRSPGSTRRATQELRSARDGRPGCVAGRSACCPPRSGWSGTSRRPRPARAGTSTPGRPHAAAVRSRGRRSVGPGRRRIRPDALSSTASNSRRIAPPIAAGEVAGGLTAGGSDATRACAGHAGRRRARRCVRRASTARGCSRPGDAIDVGGMPGRLRRVLASRSRLAGRSHPGAVARPVLVGGAMAATGAALDWLRNDILGGGTHRPRPSSRRRPTVEPGADGLVFLPYLAGERSPIWDPTARGAFVGPDAPARPRRTSPARSSRAAALAIRHVADADPRCGCQVRAMRVCGGPARSDDLEPDQGRRHGFPVEVPRVLETAVSGRRSSPRSASASSPTCRPRSGR